MESTAARGLRVFIGRGLIEVLDERWVHVVQLGRWGCKRRRACRQVQTCEDLLRDQRVLDRGDESLGGAAARAAEGVDLEDPLEKCGPLRGTPWHVRRGVKQLTLGQRIPAHN